MDELLNCVLEICCLGPAAKSKFAEFLVEKEACKNLHEAGKVADCVYEYFDLAERGTLAPLKGSIARLARTAQ